tara:strand:+ start:745 stop:939 length:195 start_codon:yes stop_codon:yes gene_type:complete
MSFTDYIEDDELLEWYAYNYDTDYLDEMISWLNKLGYKREQIIKIFDTDELFIEYYQNYLKSVE